MNFFERRVFETSTCTPRGYSYKMYIITTGHNENMLVTLRYPGHPHVSKHMAIYKRR